MEFWCRKCFGSKGCLGNFDQEPWSVTSSFTWSRMEWCIPSVLLGYFHPLGCFRKFVQFEILEGACMMNSDISQNISGPHSLWSNLIWFLLFVASIKTDITLIENFVSNQFFSKKKVAQEIRKKTFPAFRGPISQISKHIDFSFLSMNIAYFCVHFVRVCTYFAQNLHMSNQMPWIATIAYWRQKI